MTFLLFGFFKPPTFNRVLELSKVNENSCKSPNFVRVLVPKQFWFSLHRKKVRLLVHIFRKFDIFILRRFFFSIGS